MSTQLHVLFYAKKSRTTVREMIPIYLRVTIEGKRMEVTTNRFVQPHQWSASLGQVKGHSQEAEEINTYMDYLHHRIYEYQQEICRDENPVTIQSLREKWFAIADIKHTLLEVIGIHNSEMASLIGKQTKFRLGK
jgi:hypothetical protein